MNLIDKKQLFVANDSVWKALIFVGLYDAKDDQVRYQLVRRAFKYFLRSSKSCWPVHKLLNNGLTVGEALRDPNFVAKLVTKYLKHEIRNSRTESTHRVPPLKEIEKAMEICIQYGKIDTGRSILGQCSSLAERIPEPFLHSLYSLVLNAYAATGNPQAAQGLLREMKANSLSAA
jgi:hypothetical protein